jgi:PAS domain S-box-containing protein
MSPLPLTPAGGPLPAQYAELTATIVDVAALLIVVLDREARIQAFNATCERTTGFTAAEVLGEPIWGLIPEDQLAEVEVVFRELRDTGRSNLHENDWLTKSGARRRIAWSNAALRDAGGGIARVIGTGIDVTELRAAERERHESDTRLAAIVHAAMDAIVTVDEARRVVQFNPAAEKMFGRQSGEMVGQPLDVLIPERFRATHGEQMRRFARSGQTSRRMGQLGRVWGLRASAEEFPIEAAISQMRTKDGALLSVILRDVTDQERATATSALLASIVRSSDDAIIGTDLDGRILTWNPAAQGIYGYARHEIEGKPLADLVPEDAQGHLREVMTRARQGRSVGHLETVGLRQGGQRFDVSLGVAPRRDGSGAIAGASVIARDMSEQRNLERRLRQTEELAALATLVTGIAHDIGTPMNVILGYTDMLARSLRDEKNLERIRIIKEQVERVTRLIQTLMNFARPQRETPRRLQIEDVAERALGLIAETARKRGVAIERAFGPTPAILAQGERLERALLDLFVNACDAMPEGGALRVSTRPLGDGVEIAIADTGTGIALDALERIFEPFYTTKPRGKGTGLGLLVTRSIVLEHSGTIDVESELGKGTTFVLRLPRDPAVPRRDASSAS